MKMNDIEAAVEAILFAAGEPIESERIAEALEEDVDIRYIQTLMGHRSPKSTEIYLHISNKALLGVKSPFDKAVGE